ATEIREFEPSSGSGISIGILDAKHRPALAHHVQLARFIFTKRRNRQRRNGQYRLNTGSEHEDLAGTVIAVDAWDVMKRLCSPALYVVGGDQAPHVARVVVFRNRRDKAGLRARGRAKIRAAVTLQYTPAVVSAGSDNVDFFTLVLADL